MFAAPRQLVEIACIGKYSHVGTCFSAAALITISTSLTAEQTSAKIAHVADAELEHVLEVVEDHFVGAHRAVQVVHAHLVLLRFVAREHDDLLRRAELAGQHPAHEGLAHRPRAAGHENSLILEDHRGRACVG